MGYPIDSVEKSGRSPVLRSSLSFRLKIFFKQLLTVLILAWKLPFFFVTLSVFLLVSLPGALLIRQLRTQQRFHMLMTHFFCRFFLWLNGFRVHVPHRPDPQSHDLIVGNHLGLLDILVHSATRPALFITSTDMRDTPGLGLLTRMGASLYVNRRNRQNIRAEVLEIRETLLSGLNVVLFPEATSTNGEQVLPFKKTLLTAAAGTGIHIRPVVINYRRVNGEPVGLKYRDHVCWYGDQSFLSALLRILSMRCCDVELLYFEPLRMETPEQRSHVAETAYRLIQTNFTPLGRDVSAC
ncbi:MAG: lysophospholipid acyltransferase family protein [Bdellovibrio sp.]